MDRERKSFGRGRCRKEGERHRQEIRLKEKKKGGGYKA